MSVSEQERARVRERRTERKWKEETALQMPASLAGVFCIAFSICTLHALITLRFRCKALDRSPQRNVRGIVSI